MERDFSELDKNYRNASVDGVELEFHPGFEAPVKLEGFPFVSADGRLCRIPDDIVARCETDLSHFACLGAGEQLRFRTDSPYFGIHATFSEINVGHNRRAGVGFDAYVHLGEDSRFVGNQQLPIGEEVLTAVWKKLLPTDGDLYDVTLVFPCVSAVATLDIGLKPGSRLEAPTPHRRPGLIVFYGSSLTHYGAASRPGLMYPSLIGRMLDIETVNLGFAARCKGDLAIAEEVARLDPVVFVMEFDHNAPDSGFLAERHEKFFRHFRSLRPETPVLLTSKPDIFKWQEDDSRRRDVVVRTWQKAVSEGDRNVDFLDGETLFAGPLRYECTNDNCHQNDIGEALMAERITDRLRCHVFSR